MVEIRRVNFLAARFVAGNTAEEALDAVHRLNEVGLKASLDVLGEETRSLEQAQAAVREYSQLLGWIGASGLDCNVSVKLTQLGLSLGDGPARDNLLKILDAAAKHGNFVRIDMEGSAYTQRTLDLFHGVFESRKNVGVVIQAYLRRSASDVKELNRAGARVRLCKGAYKEPPSVAFQEKEEVNRSYDALALELLERGNYPGFATHDDARIEAILAAAAGRGIPNDRFEFQMLYGVRKPRWTDLKSRGFNVRIYVPYGTHWLPYYYRRIRERKENLIFALRSVLGR